MSEAHPIAQRAERAERQLKAVLAMLGNPSPQVVASACLTYAHDFGLRPPVKRKRMMVEAKQWAHAWLREVEDVVRRSGQD